jgi:hypothetical protein
MFHIPEEVFIHQILLFLKLAETLLYLVRPTVYLKNFDIAAGNLK